MDSALLVQFYLPLQLANRKQINIYPRPNKKMLKDQSTEPLRRLWRTPSPSSTAMIKSSSRYLRSGLFQKNSPKNLKTDMSNELRSKPMLHSFKNQLVELKQQANKMSNGVSQPSTEDQIQKNENPPNKPSIPHFHTHSHRSYTNQQESYETYYSKFPKPSTSIDIKNNINIKEKEKEEVVPSLMRSKNGQSAYHQMGYHGRYEEEVRKILEENLRLGEEYRGLKDRYEGLLVVHGKIESELSEWKKEYEMLKAKYEQKIKKEKQLNEQVHSYKEILQTNNLDLTKNPPKLRSQPQPQPHPKPNPQPPCQSCKSAQKTLISLNNALENKMYEIGKKDATISSLCADLHKLDNELKLLDKPKAVFKKICSQVQEVNQMVMVCRARELSARLGGKGFV